MNRKNTNISNQEKKTKNGENITIWMMSRHDRTNNWNEFLFLIHASWKKEKTEKIWIVLS